VTVPSSSRATATRTHLRGELGTAQVGEQVELCGWGRPSSVSTASTSPSSTCEITPG
jgi:hypothetical protein